MKYKMKKYLIFIILAVIFMIGCGKVHRQPGEYADNIAVNFADINLETVIREWIIKPTGQIYTDDLKWMTLFFAESKDIKDLTGLQFCVNLQWLDLSGNNIEDIAVLRNLFFLEVLKLHNNQKIKDISALADLTNLISLDLENNKISDISSLQNCTYLERLNLEGNQIVDIRPLLDLKYLQFLYLSRNPLDMNPGSTANAVIETIKSRDCIVIY